MSQMERIAVYLANELLGKIQRLVWFISKLKEIYWQFLSFDPECRLLVGIAGIPGSGKTSLARMIVHQINLRTKDPSISSPAAILVGLDGWHLTRDRLRAMADPKLAFDQRGAHWTFDPISYYSFVKRLREPISGSGVIKAPSFDHALKDPTPESIHILASHRIVIIEGLYVLLTENSWKEATDLLDERWLIDVDVEEARRRLLKRHVITGVAADETEAVWRVDNNDMTSKQPQTLSRFSSE
jgi:pantothenate kinase